VDFRRFEKFLNEIEARSARSKRIRWADPGEQAQPGEILVTWLRPSPSTPMPEQNYDKNRFSEPTDRTNDQDA
jgi:hypothetical protein